MPVWSVIALPPAWSTVGGVVAGSTVVAPDDERHAAAHELLARLQLEAQHVVDRGRTVVQIEDVVGRVGIAHAARAVHVRQLVEGRRLGAGAAGRRVAVDEPDETGHRERDRAAARQPAGVADRVGEAVGRAREARRRRVAERAVRRDRHRAALGGRRRRVGHGRGQRERVGQELAVVREEALQRVADGQRDVADRLVGVVERERRDVDRAGHERQVRVERVGERDAAGRGRARSVVDAHVVAQRVARVGLRVRVVVDDQRIALGGVDDGPAEHGGREAAPARRA